jgi:hypothetical protein
MKFSPPTRTNTNKMETAILYFVHVVCHFRETKNICLKNMQQFILLVMLLCGALICRLWLWYVCAFLVCFVAYFVVSDPTHPPTPQTILLDRKGTQRRPNMGPEWTQNTSKMVPNGPNKSQNISKSVEKLRKRPQHGPKWA